LLLESPRRACSSFVQGQWYNSPLHINGQGGNAFLDGIIRLIEGLVRSIIGIIQPLFDNGSLGYVIPFLLLLVATGYAVSGRNRANLAGYILGWFAGIAIIGLYLEARGDAVLTNLTGNLPRPEITGPLILGFLIGFLVLAPFIRMRLIDSIPIIVAVTTLVSIVVMFLTYRCGAMIPDFVSQGTQDLIVYRKRYFGVLALAFGAGVLLHVVVSAANQPPPLPPLPPKQR
jgi:hypothetical protein